MLSKKEKAMRHAKAVKHRQDHINDYNRANYDRVAIMLPKGRKDVVKARASTLGMSTSAYIASLIDADLASAESE